MLGSSVLHQAPNFCLPMRRVSVETVAGEAGSSAHIMTLKADDKCSVFDNGAYLSATYTCQNIGRTFTPDVQTVTTTTRPTTGKFRISFNGDHTADIDWATASSATQATAEAAQGCDRSACHCWYRGRDAQRSLVDGSGPSPSKARGTSDQCRLRKDSRRRLGSVAATVAPQPMRAV